MILLDEQLCREPLRMAIAQWHRGKIRCITDLRPSSVIKDDAAPELLLSVKQPTLVTINYKDFWRKIAAHRDYCAICIDLPTSDGLKSRRFSGASCAILTSEAKTAGWER
jgi:hypothetical protein